MYLNWYHAPSMIASVVILLIANTSTSGFVINSDKLGYRFKPRLRVSCLFLGRISTQQQIQGSSIPSSRSIISFIESTCQPYMYSEMNATTVNYWGKMRAYIHRATRAKTPLTMAQVQSVVQFLLQIFGRQSPSALCDVLRNHPRILRKSAQYKLEPTVLLLQKLYGSMFYEAIEKNPSLLLVTGVGFEAPQNKVRRNYHFPEEAEQQDTTSVESFLLNTVGIKRSQVDKLKDNHPKAFQLSMSSNVKPVFDFLLSQCPTSNKHIESNPLLLIQRIIAHNPNILSLDVTSNLQPKIKFLKDRCGLDGNDIQQVLYKSPGLLCLSLREKYENMLQILEYLLTSTKADAIHHVKQRQLLPDRSKTSKSVLNPVLRQCLMRHPQLLALSIKNLKAKALYFDTIDYLSIIRDKDAIFNDDELHAMSSDSTLNRPSLISRIASTIPSVLSLSIHNNIIPTVSTLANAWGSSDISHVAQNFIMTEINMTNVPQSLVSSVDLSQMLGEFTGVLSLSLESNIYPTLKFYNMTGYIHLDSNGYGINPKLRGRYIASSLVNCLLPRWNYCISERGLIRQNKERPSIHVLAGSNDTAFCKNMGFNFDDYIHYKELSLPVFKFKSQFDTWLQTGKPIDPT